VALTAPQPPDPAPGQRTPDPPLVRLRDVIKVYREVDVETIALRGLDLDVAAGEFVAVMGRSGSGKSTLLNLLSGSDRPTAGSVSVAGVALDRADEALRSTLRGRTVGICFQDGNLVPFLSLLENVRLAAHLAGRDDSAEVSGILLRRVGLDERAAHRPDALSGGEQQRASLACVLAGRPSLLLADEITGELDSATAATVLDLVGEVHAREGTTVILVTHDPEVAARADRIVELRDGRILSDERAPVGVPA
jgi:ABC-type lipoprotein export system ATPase subunit